MKKKLLITTSSFGSMDLLNEFEVVLNPFGRRLSENEVMALIEKHQPNAIIAGVEPLTRKVFSLAKNLNVVSRCGVGLDSVDLEVASELGIEIFNTPQAPVDGVAELTIALILSRLRNIPHCDASMKAGLWEKEKGFLLKYQKIGIVGCGRIGSRIAEIITVFGSDLYGYDPHITEHHYCKMISLEELFSTCDVITLHLPLLPSTEGLVSRDLIAKMKKGAILINTARGPIVDEEAVYEAVRNNKIAGIAFDVFKDEPYAGNLIKLGKETILSPHQGTNTVEGRKVMEQEAIYNLKSFYEGKNNA